MKTKKYWNKRIGVRSVRSSPTGAVEVFDKNTGKRFAITSSRKLAEDEKQKLVNDSKYRSLHSQISKKKSVKFKEIFPSFYNKRTLRRMS